MRSVFTLSFFKGALAVSMLALAAGPANAQSKYRFGQPAITASQAPKAASRASAATSLPQSAEVHLPNSSGAGWVLTEKVKFTYDAQGRETSRTTYDLSNQPVMKDSVLFDGQGSETFSAGYNWQNGNWVLNWGYRNLITYNTAGKAIEKISQILTTNQWQNSNRETTTYNAANFPLEIINSEWQANTWMPEEKTMFTYAVSTNPPTEMVYQEYFNGNWRNTEKYINLTWHDFDKFEPLTFEGQDWDGTAWESYYRGTAVYDAFGGFVGTQQEWDGTNWVNANQYNELYDTRSNYIGYRDEEWTGTSWMVDYEEAHVLTYNPLDQITERIFRGWDSMTNSLKDERKEVYSNFRLLGIAKNLPQLQARVYPNPASNVLRIQIKSAEPVTATLTDLTGKTVLTKTFINGAAEHQLDVAKVAKGTYILKLASKKESSIQKILKQ